MQSRLRQCLAIWWMMPIYSSVSLIIFGLVMAGHGWSYNIGDATNPITAPLYAFFLAGAKVFGLPAPITISLTYLLGLFALGVGVYVGLLSVNGRAAALTIAILISSAAIPVSSWGMETSFFLACIVFAVLSFEHGHFRIAGGVCALAALCRPEGLAMVVILVGTYVFERRKLPWGMMLVFLLLLMPWLLYSLFAYGHVLPNSVSVKAVQRNIGWFKTQPPWLLYFLGQPKLPWLTYSLALVGLYRVLSQLRQHRFVVLVMTFSVVQVAAYSVKSAPTGYFWYLAPGNMALDFLIALGAFALFGRVVCTVRQTMPENVKIGLTCMLVIVTMSKLGAAPMTLVKPYRLGDEYREAGEWIKGNTPKTDIVAATEIGYIGYFSGREIRDIHGLIHPQALPFLKREEWDWWFKINPPQVVVTHVPEWDGEPSDNAGWAFNTLADFRTQYAKVATFGQVNVYKRQADAP